MRNPTVEEIAEKALAATVYLEMTDSNGQTLGFGSGSFVGQNQIVTNFHVIEGASKGTAKLVSKSTKYTIEGISATDEQNDLAILKVTAFGIEPLPLGDSDTVKIGQTVYAAGNPEGLEGTFSDGIISSLREDYTQKRLQMTAPISPGSSGGPVLNDSGEVIGVSFATFREGQNLNFAIPSNYLKELLTRSGEVTPLSWGEQSISAEALLTWGHTKCDLGLYHEAIAAYDQAILLKPDFANAYSNRGVAKTQLGQYSAAVADYDMAIRLDPTDASVYYFRGIVKAELYQHGAAIVDYDAAIRLKPDYASAYYNRGVAKTQLGHHGAAIADYDAAIHLEPDDASAYVKRGTVKTQLGQHDAAIADYDMAILLSPADASVYYFRGTAKGILGQYFDAIADYDMTILLKPDFADAYTWRGFAKATLGQYFDAAADFDAAIHLEPDDAFAYANRGLANYKLDRTWEAELDLRTALQLAEQSGDEDLKVDIESMLQTLD